MGFALDQRLADSSYLIARIDGIQVRLANDSRYVWLVLVPECEGARELHDLADDLRDQMMALATQLGGWMKPTFTADKINIAAIGNLVPQLHLHVVARRRDDAAWPAPIWGHGEPVELADVKRDRLVTAIATFLETRETG